MTHRLSVEAALTRILNQLPASRTITIQTTASLGFVLANDIIAAVNLPPFANSAMDGFAVNSADIESVPTKLPVVMDLPAGTPPPRPLQRGGAARIMTGAPMPEGADTVVPVEQTDATFSDTVQGLVDTVTINKPTDVGKHIRLIGENIRKGETVLTAGTVIRPQDIGMLIGLGVTEVPVFKQPRVVVLSTGDELIGPDETLTPGKIRDTNSYTITALVQEIGGDPYRLPPAPDEHSAVAALFERALAMEPDVIVSTAGVSVGVFDVVRTVLDDIGSIDFWKVNVRPGKPLAFGSIQGIPFFGLPGNPVSAMVTFDLFVRPALLKLAGRHTEPPHVTAFTAEKMASDGRRTYVRVRLHREDDRLIATPTGTQSSGALMSMVLADGLLIIPDNQTHVPARTPLQVRLLRDSHFRI